MSSPNQPYGFGNVQGIVQGAGKKAAGFFKTKGKAAEKQLDHEYRVREMAIGTTLKTEAEKKLMKSKRKQEQKLTKTKGRQERKTYESKMASNVASAAQMASIAKPGSGVNLSDRGVSYTTPPATKAPAKPKETKAKASAPTPKPKPQPSLARRAQMGKSMQKKGIR